MKELFRKLKHVKPEEINARESVLLDTCFVVYLFEKQNEKRLLSLMEQFDVGMTSFNVEELDHIKHRIDERVRERLRHFLKKNDDLFVVEVDVHPGNRKSEEDFIRRVDPYLLEDVPDVSDGVLMAAAIVSHSDVLTRDKHHLFTTKLENYLQRYGIEVFNHIPELMKNK